jgi:4-hydroxybenzoate polyprenyltransferase/phosphoserine phosphatase
MARVLVSCLCLTPFRVTGKAAARSKKISGRKSGRSDRVSLTPQPATRTAVLSPPQVPLCVDLDGTLIKTDLLWESLLLLLKRYPLMLFVVPLWLLQGKAHLKREIGRRVRLDVTVLPYNDDVVEYLRNERRGGRTLVLATASQLELATDVAAHLGFFDHVLGTEAVNLKGVTKRKALEERFGSRGYDYIGNSSADLPVWSHANQALIVSRSPSLVARVRKAGVAVGRVFEERRSLVQVLSKALRVHQWAKNVLVLVPLISSHQVFHGSRMLAALVAFSSFSFCASGVYILNDCLDLEADRHHPKKKRRPFAAGTLSIPAGLALSLGCLILSFALSTVLPTPFFFVLAVYFILTTSYSLYVKQFVLIDVIVLAQLYTVRVYAGGAAAGIVPSHWLLTFSLFIFLSLALMKRFTEIKLVSQSDRVSELDQKDVRGRGYRTTDAEHIASIGSSSGLIAVLVLALYINSKEVLALYSHPEVLWLVCPVMLYWITRAWMLTYRDRMDDDPVVFAVRDQKSYIVALLIGVILVLAK